MSSKDLPARKLGLDWLMSQAGLPESEGPAEEERWTQIGMAWPLWLPTIPQVRQTVEVRRFLKTTAATTALIPFLVSAEGSERPR